MSGLERTVELAVPPLMRTSSHSRTNTPNATAFLKVSKAFTLVELLMVMAIICLMLVAIGPSLSSLSSSSYANSISQIAQAFDLARQHAMAKNTYVWVGLYNGNAGSAGPYVALCVVESKTGTDLLDPTPNAVQLPSGTTGTNYTTVQKTKRISQMQLLDPGVITQTQIPSLPILSVPAVGLTNTVGASFQITVPPPPSPYNPNEIFDHIVEFKPNGEACVLTSQPGASPSLVGEIELGLKQWPRNQPAVIRLNGLTGLATVYY